MKDDKEFDKFYMILLIIFSMILFYICVLTRNTTDYPTHSASMAITPLRPLLNPFNWHSYFLERGYPLWHITGRMIMIILNCPKEWAAGINSGLWLVLSYFGVVKSLKYLVKSVDGKILAILSFGLFIVAPIWLPWVNEHIVLGVGGTNVWHNATNICGRAIGILAFFYSMKLLDEMVGSGYSYLPPLRRGIELSLLFVLSLIAKPSFAQTFAPAFGLLLIFHLIKSKGAFFREFLCFIAIAFLPALKLGSQFFHYFGTTSGEEGLYTLKSSEGIIVILPEMSNVINVIGKQILVLFFPITVIISLLITKSRLDKYHAVTWTMLLIGVVYTLVLKGAATGEMGWAYYIAAFMVFMIGIRDYAVLFFSSQAVLVQSRVNKTLYVISTIALVEQIFVGIFYLYELIICGERVF